MKKQKMQMKKSKITIVLLFVFSSLCAQSGVEQYYINLPVQVEPATTSKQRTELLEYYKPEMADSIANRFNGQVHLLEFDDQYGYMKLQNTPVSVMEIKLFSNSQDTIIGIIKTVCTPICQSQVNFYSTQWQKREDVKLTMPKAIDWMDEKKVKNSEFTMENLINTFQANFISLSFNPQKDEIIAVNNSLQFLDDYKQEKYVPLFLEAPIVFRLENKRWVKK